MHVRMYVKGTVLVSGGELARCVGYRVQQSTFRLHSTLSL